MYLPPAGKLKNLQHDTFSKLYYYQKDFKGIFFKMCVLQLNQFAFATPYSSTLSVERRYTIFFLSTTIARVCEVSVSFHSDLRLQMFGEGRRGS